MSRTREIAIELFGQEEGQKMEPADVYYRLAQIVIDEAVEIEISLNTEFQKNVLVPAQTTKDFITEGLLATDMAKDSMAYAMGYRAQMEDALASESERHANLNDLAAMCRIINGSMPFVPPDISSS